MFSLPHRAELCGIFQCQFRELQQLLEEEGREETFQRLLTLLDMTPGDMASFSREKFTAAYFQLNKLQQLPCMGLRLGARKGVKSFGAFGLGAITAPSWGQGFKLIPWAVRTVWGDLGVLTHAHGAEGGTNWVSWRLHINPSIPKEMAINVTDEIVVSSARLLLECLPKVDPSQCKVHLSHPRQPGADVCQRSCPAPWTFDQPFSEIRIPVEWLDRPAMYANAAVHLFCEELCKAMYRHDFQQESLATKVRDNLLGMDLKNAPDLKAVAEQLKMTSRSLQAGLIKEGKSFREILLSTKIELAQHHLRNTSFPLQEIAYLLGFTHTPNFYRAFSKATGQTPQQFRNQSEHWQLG